MMNNMKRQRQTRAIHHHTANSSLVLVQRAKQLFRFPCLQLVFGCMGELEGGSHEVYIFLHKFKLSQGVIRAQCAPFGAITQFSPPPPTRTPTKR